VSPVEFTSAICGNQHPAINGACNEWGDTMPTSNDLVELARICLSQARTAHNSEASAALFQLAHEYSHRAIELDSANIHDLRQR
jgi:hypothetical protein